MRPTVFQVGKVVYWVIQTRNPDTGVLKDADSTPTVAVRKNGASVGDSVTVTKRSATTGIYDCEYNSAGEAEGDAFTIEESATVTGTTTSSATYNFSWNVRCVAVERGTDSAALAATALSNAVWTDAKAVFVDAAISTRSTFAGGAVASVTGSVGSVTAAVELDSATQTQIDKIEAAVAGTVTGAGTSTEVFVGPSATLTITVDSSGNRSNVEVT